MLKVRLDVVRRLSVIGFINLKRVTFCVVIVSILLNSAYFGFQFVDKSTLYEDHGFTTSANVLNNLVSGKDLIFANNYIYMRPYVNDTILRQGLLLPPPDTKEEFLKLLAVTPNNTLIIISSDSATTWYEYANNYVKNYVFSSVITPEMPNVVKLPRYNLTKAILKMSFDDVNETTIPDDSGFGNNGINHGAVLVQGYYGNALKFDGKGYVSVPSTGLLNVRKSITISFLAKIDKADPLKGYMIVSKGYAGGVNYNGSYDVFVWNSRIYFELGGVGFISINATKYVGTWHHFIFTYDGDKMEIYVDGSVVASKPATGLIKASSYNLEIGRDSERGSFYFVGSIDELQVSDQPLNVTDLMRSYYTYYAVRVDTLRLPEGQIGFYRIINENKNGICDKCIAVKALNANMEANLTIVFRIQIESPETKNIAIFVATDRFTKIYIVAVNPGLNDVNIKYNYVVDPSWYEPGGLYWLHLAQARIIVIDNGQLVYNKFLAIQNLYLINSSILAISSAVVVASLVLRRGIRSS